MFRSYGSVWRAVDLRDNSLVAIKVLHNHASKADAYAQASTMVLDQGNANLRDDSGDDEESNHMENDTLVQDLLTAELEKEIRILSESSCPYIVAYKETFAHRKYQEIWIVMEYCPGGSLNDLVKKNGPLQEDQVAHLLRHVLEGVKYLHDNNKIHRDIKPHNLLLNGNVCKLADFGVSAVLGSPDALRTTCTGTPIYMAPEVNSISTLYI